VFLSSAGAAGFSFEDDIPLEVLRLFDMPKTSSGKVWWEKLLKEKQALDDISG
jgi:hypothetical protein